MLNVLHILNIVELLLCDMCDPKEEYPCPLTRRQTGGGLTHASRTDSKTLLLEPSSPLLLQLLLDLVNLLC